MTDDQHTTDAASQGSPKGRRPYRAPELKYLGSVRDLTLGKTAGKKFDTFVSTKK